MTPTPRPRRRFVDLSIFLENDVLSDPPPLAPKITYQKHADTVPEFMQMLPGTRPEDFPDGEAAAAEWVTLTTHSGTHLDAPWHFHSTMDAATGQPRKSWTIDEVPLEWCFQRGVKLDFRHFPDGYVATAADVEAELARIGVTLEPLDIVVVNTRAGSRYGQSDYVRAGCGMGREATLYLLERGVRLTGTDAWSWDAPFAYTAEKVRETGDVSLIWEGHKVGRDIGYCHLEKLHNLEALPATGFMISCFPHKIRAASAGWTRAVAIFDEPSGVEA
jgi:kynurenine formamidase